MQKHKLEFFNKFAEDLDSYPAHKNLGRVIKETNIKKGSFICDVGTGTGVLIPYILKGIGEKGRVIAVDYSPAMIDKAKTKYHLKNVEFLVVDIHKTMFPDEYFDYVIANACFPHFERKNVALKEIYRILKKNGVVVISHPTGRDFVNKIHQNSGGCIKKDIVPAGSALAKILHKFSLTPLKVIDEPEFYFVSAVKSCELSRTLDI